MMQFLSGRALVTGAGRGIGKETARQLAVAGAQVVALSRSANDLAVLQAEVTQVVAAALVARGRPRAFVNVSSVAARVGLPLHAAYCASKAGLDALTRVMAVELGPHGIRTNSVNPTVTLTPMAERAWSDPGKALPMQARIPLGRFVKPGEVVSAILFLLSDAASMINGVCLDVDGGLRAA